MRPSGAFGNFRGPLCPKAPGFPGRGGRAGPPGPGKPEVTLQVPSVWNHPDRPGKCREVPVVVRLIDLCRPIGRRRVSDPVSRGVKRPVFFKWYAKKTAVLSAGGRGVGKPGAAFGRAGLSVVGKEWKEREKRWSFGVGLAGRSVEGPVRPVRASGCRSWSRPGHHLECMGRAKSVGAPSPVRKIQRCPSLEVTRSQTAAFGRARAPRFFPSHIERRDGTVRPSGVCNLTNPWYRSLFLFLIRVPVRIFFR